MNVKWEDVKEDFARKDSEIEKLKAMNGELVEALKEIDDYLSTDIETTIGNDSAIHRKIQCKLTKAKGE
jgi:hypothetical protein